MVFFLFVVYISELLMPSTSELKTLLHNVVPIIIIIIIITGFTTALEHFVALSIFASYLESSGFLFTSYGLHKIDFYGSYYLGIISLVCSLVSAFVVYLNRSATRRNKPKQSCEFDFSNPEHLKLLWEFYQQQGYFQGSNGDLGHGEGLETDPLLPTGMLPHRSEEESLGYDNGGYEELHDMERTAHGGWYRSPPNVAS